MKTILDKEHKGSTIIFCRTRHDARGLVKDLSYDSYILKLNYNNPLIFHFEPNMFGLILNFI